MAPRRRVGVVVLLDAPVADWIDGVRRAAGDSSIDRIRPHVTLVPPLNLKEGDLEAGLARLRAAAAAVEGPLELTVGPPATFLPANPVLYLEVGGDLVGLRALRDAVFVPPLQRSLSWPWVPHLTLADGLPHERIEMLARGITGFAARASIERVTLLEERHTDGGRRWVPAADAALGPPSVIARGGLPLTMTEGRTVNPLGAELLGSPVPVAVGTHADDPRRRVVLEAHREGILVGVAVAWLADDGGHVRVTVAAGQRGTGVGSHLLAAVENAVRRQGWDCPVLQAEGPPEFYRARSAWSRPPG